MATTPDRSAAARRLYWAETALRRIEQLAVECSIRPEAALEKIESLAVGYRLATKETDYEDGMAVRAGVGESEEPDNGSSSPGAVPTASCGEAVPQDVPAAVEPRDASGYPGLGNMTHDQAAAMIDLEAGSDEERRWRGEWMSRLMFGWIVGQRDPGTYEAWLTANGARLV